MKKIILLGAFLSAICSYGQIINSNDFEAWNDEHEYVQSSWTADGFTTPWVNGFNQQRCFVDDAHAQSGTKSLRVLYPAGGVGPSQTGAQAPLQFAGEDEVYMSYWLRFSDDFDWGGTSEGGKLPGFGSGANCSGGSSCDGTNGFSSRLMWRAGGRAVLYFYHMDKPATYGEDIQLRNPDQSDVVFEKGKWYQVAQRVKINSGNNYDAEVDVWINGEIALSLTGYRLVNNGDKVDNFYFSTFHGGSGSNWAPSNDCHIWYDDIIVSTNESDVFGSICKNVPDFESPMTLCPETSVMVASELDEQLYTINWFEGGDLVGQGANLEITEPGEYELVRSSNECAVQRSSFIVVEPPLLDANPDTICEPGNAVPSINGGGDYTWYASPFDDNPLNEGDSYEVAVSQSETYFVEEGQLDQYMIGRSEQTGATWNTSSFDASDKRHVLTNTKTVTLEAVTINSTNTDNEINLRILAADESTVLHEIGYTVVTGGMNRIPVGIELDPGTYMFDLVGSSKGVRFETENSNYPLSIPGVLSIDCNVAYQCSNGWYGFFYDWEFSVGSVSECRTPVEAVIDPQNSSCTITSLLDGIQAASVYPNPTNGSVYLPKTSSYEVFDSIGNKVLNGDAESVDMTELTSGIYFIKVNGEVHRVAKQ